MRRNLSIVAFLGAFFQTTHSGPAVKKGTLSTVVPPKVVAIVPLSFNDEENSITTRSFLVESNDGQNDVWNYIDSSNLPSTDLNTSPRIQTFLLQNLRTDKELDYASVISSYLWNMFRAKSPSTSRTTKLTIKSDVYLKPRKFPPTSSQLKELNESTIASDQCSLPKCLRKTNAPPGTYISSVLDSVSEIEDMDDMEGHKTINGIDQQKGEKGGGKPSRNQRSKEKFHQDSIIAQLDDVSSFERNILINSSGGTPLLYSTNVSTVSPEILELNSSTEDVETTKNSFDDKSRNKSIILENEQNRLINKSSEFPSSSPLPSISISPSQSPSTSLSSSSSPSTSPSQPPPSSSTSSSLVVTSNQSNASFVVQSQTSSSPLPVTFGIDQQRVLPTEFVHPTDGTFDTLKGTKTAAYRDPSASTTPLPPRNFADLPSADDINVTKANHGSSISRSVALISTPDVMVNVTTTTIVRTTPANVSKCVLSEWTLWTTCSDTCGGCGSRSRIRLCYRPNNGKRCTFCDGATSEVEACNFDICLYPRTTTCCGGLDVVTINNKWLCAAPENIL